MSRQFARTFDMPFGQALAYLCFDEREEFVMIVQVWNKEEDHQLRACVEFPEQNEEEVWELFENFHEDELDSLISNLKMTKLG